MSIPHEISSDCGGAAELVTVTMRAPFSLNLIGNLLFLWLVLQLRAVGFSRITSI